MSGETDLARMLASLQVTRRAEPVTFVTLDAPAAELCRRARAVISEDEGVTLVLDVDDARRAGLPVGFVGAWLTLTVHSALEAVGLTAHVSRVLADAGIACNVLAGYHHDHLVVPFDRADEAIRLLTAR